MLTRNPSRNSNVTGHGNGRESVVIVGAGIVGTAVARELSRYSNLDVTLLERGVDVASGTTKANSGIIHAGYDDDQRKYPVRGSLCAKGNDLWHDLAKKLGISVSWCGSLVVAKKEEDISILDDLYDRGLKNGVPNMRILDAEESQGMEPNIPGLVASLWAPSEGTTLPYEAAIALAENAIDNGVSVRLSTEVRDIEEVTDGIKVVTNRGEFKADWVVNAAGLYGDKISHMVGIYKSNIGVDIRIHPRKGEYFVFENECGCPVNHIIFPTPTPITKGVLIWPDVEGNTVIGPTAQDLPEDRKEDTSTTSEGLDEVYESVKKMVPGVPPRDRCIKNFAGLRAEPPHADFIIEGYDRVPGFINAIGVRSPGLASAPMIAKRVVDLMREQGFEPEEKPDFNPYRERIPKFYELSLEEKERLIKQNKRYANVVCWCEAVTEGEIVEAIRRGARTMQGISFRTRAMMGRCQGGACLSRVVEILSRELNIPQEKITSRYGDDHLFIGHIKDLRGGEN